MRYISLLLVLLLLVLTAGCSHEVESYMCRTDDCRAITIDSLSSARHSVYFMSYSLTDDSIANSLIEAKQRGVEVKGVMEKQQSSQYSKFDILKQAGVIVRWDDNKALMHHKVFIIDNCIVLTGSVNPTENGYQNNDENLVVIYSKEIAQKFTKEFNRVYGL